MLLLAILLAVVLVGVLIFLYLLIHTPDGTLTVTFAKQDAVTPVATASTPAPAIDAALSTEPGLPGRLGQLDKARQLGLISDEEHAARRTKILNEA